MTGNTINKPNNEVIFAAFDASKIDYVMIIPTLFYKFHKKLILEVGFTNKKVKIKLNKDDAWDNFIRIKREMYKQMEEVKRERINCSSVRTGVNS